MFRFFRDLLNYLYPPKRWRKPPGHLINTYNIDQADEQEELLMLLNKARSPAEAARLMRRYKVTHALDLLPLLPPRHKTSVKTRLVRLVRKFLGHQEGDPYRCYEAAKDKTRI